MNNSVEQIAVLINQVRSKSPLVHNITNYVTVNDCANVLLASGSSPIMADDIEEVADITSICNALVINIGTLNLRTIASMIKAGKKANELQQPVILDPVGAGASKLRTDTVFKLLEEVKFTVIRGNISEIKTLYAGSGSTKGVDANVEHLITADNVHEAVALAKELSERIGAIIAVTGAIDIIANNQKAYLVNNGHAMMGQITGTGCMLSALIGAFCAANTEQQLEATVAAIGMMGLAGELAYTETIAKAGGTASFRMHLIDFISKIDGQMLKEGMKIEVK